eukprot:scaffold4161_cov101-Isochrysis_galbana.AAC.3
MERIRASRSSARACSASWLGATTRNQPVPPGVPGDAALCAARLLFTAADAGSPPEALPHAPPTPTPAALPPGTTRRGDPAGDTSPAAAASSLAASRADAATRVTTGLKSCSRIDARTSRAAPPPFGCLFIQARCRQPSSPPRAKTPARPASAATAIRTAAASLLPPPGSGAGSPGLLSGLRPIAKAAPAATALTSESILASRSRAATTAPSATARLSTARCVAPLASRNCSRPPSGSSACRLTSCSLVLRVLGSSYSIRGARSVPPTSIAWCVTPDPSVYSACDPRGIGAQRSRCASSSSAVFAMSSATPAAFASAAATCSPRTASKRSTFARAAAAAA